MKLDRIILHIGPHKTGSTTIQQVCAANRDRLRDFGILYPLGRWHPQFGSFFCDRPHRFVFNELSGRMQDDQTRQEDHVYMEQLLKQVTETSCRQMILSYEGFIELDAGALRAMRKLLCSLSGNVTVVAYARPPLSFACSELSQKIKFGLCRALGTDEALRPGEFILAYKDFLPKFGTVFGTRNVIVRKFLRSEFPEGHVAYDFLSVLGIPMDLARFFTTTAEKNESLSVEAALIGAAISRIDSATPNEFLARYVPTLERIRGARITLTTRQADLILASASEHLDWLAKNYGIAFESENHLIDDSPRPLTHDTIESVASELYRLINQTS